jgi:hypothetical protein
VARRTQCVAVAGAAVVCLAAAGCWSPSDEVREDFSRELSCPKGSIQVRTRADVDAYDLTHDSRKPPADVAANPQRLAVWQSNQERDREYSRSHYGVLEAKGCGSESLYECVTTTSTGKSSHGNTGWGCSKYAYKPGIAKW